MGFEDQIPKRLSLLTEFFNADVFFTATPLNNHLLRAYKDANYAILERLLLINLFMQGPGYWQAGGLKPSATASSISHTPKIYTGNSGDLYWSGTDTSPWQEIAKRAANMQMPDTDSLDDIICDHTSRFVT